MSIDPSALVAQRRRRLHQVMAAEAIPAFLTSDPFSIRYATGCRNMLVHGLTGPDRLALVVESGPTILWEFAGCEHLSAAADHVDEVRPSPALNAKKTVHWADEVERYATEVAADLVRLVGPGAPVALDRLEAPITEALGNRDVKPVDGTGVIQRAMAIKQPAEIDAMRRAAALTMEATHDLEAALQAGRTEQEVWGEFHRSLIAGGGELVVTRLLQAGSRTFPYFQEASEHAMEAGDLVCFDSDAVGAGGYSVDFSRTFLCDADEGSPRQRQLYRLALDQLEHNAANLAPGRSFEAFAAGAFEVPPPHARYGYYQLAHGLGLAGGHPNVPRIGDEPYPLPGEIEPSMVLCVESYIGDPDSGQGVKLENQYLVHDDHVENMSPYPWEARLLS